MTIAVAVKVRCPGDRCLRERMSSLSLEGTMVHLGSSEKTHRTADNSLRLGLPEIIQEQYGRRVPSRAWNMPALTVMREARP